MKTTITYRGEFVIPKNLPHQSNGGEDEPGFYNDSISVEPEGLVLRSGCGKTTFASWVERADSYRAGIHASYEGAYHAINSVRGIAFPVCSFGEVESSYGKFKSMIGYELARRCITFAKVSDFNNRVDQASIILDDIADYLGNPEF